MSAVLSAVVQSKTESIAAYILGTSFWESYLQAEKTMLDNPETRVLIDEIRRKQTEGAEVDELLERLETYPEVLRFQSLQTELGECLSKITQILGWTVEGLEVVYQVRPTSCDLPST
ncbi:MAG: hypothetical protein JWN30_2583 [Bacilli bacterium]|nr:hypothetical protein [Bacilli bacterium]